MVETAAYLKGRYDHWRCMAPQVLLNLPVRVCLVSKHTCTSSVQSQRWSRFFDLVTQFLSGLAFMVCNSAFSTGLC